MKAWDKLRDANRIEGLLPLLAEVGSPTVRQIFELQFELRMQGLTTILATTLDLIGLLESLTNRRLVGKAVRVLGNVWCTLCGRSRGYYYNHFLG